MTRSAGPRDLPGAYWRLTGAAGVGAVGEGAFAAAAPLLAATLTGDPRLVSVVSASVYLPWLLLSLVAGAVVDRYDRVGLMWCAQAVQAVIAGVVAILVASDRLGIPTLAILVFGLGTCQVVAGNAGQAVLPDIVGQRLLHAANGYQQSIVLVGRQFAGPPVGSVLFAAAAALPFVADAGALAIAAMLLATLAHSGPRSAAHPPAGHPPAGHPPVRTAIAEGLRWLARHRLLRLLAVLLGVNTFCFHLGNATLVLLATRTLHVDAAGYGLLLATAAVGGLLGGVAGPRIVAGLGTRATLFAALGTNAAVFGGVGVSPDATVLGALLAVNGFATTLWTIITVSLRQRLVPSRLLGRVNSIYRMVGWGLIPLGALAGGLVAHVFGLRAPFPVAGAIRAAALLATGLALARAMAVTLDPRE
ncbi:transmembrane secretion effector [Haloactinopolyspora alba]|uniref:Transmembrane secretion effector n=1 Tax=Haloactinopolyspora alba TaxID=648780 RepID=A0A2P8DWP0_9ACTN|nr:MFS transporter [Haloactinopolyspora alba]PSL01633.1 transmembrane secretion effector [Haloactinopolyspora alba]